MIKFRSETCDYNIFRSINQFNEYRLPERFYEDDIIIDIGAHIGSFTFACLYRGAGKVIAFEPEPENFRLACAHFADYKDRVEVHPYAVWRSDLKGDHLLCHCGYPCTPSEVNTGGGNVIFQSPAIDQSQASQTIVKTIRLDRILRGYPTVRLLKLDCEGSEWPILLTSRLLDRIEAICGEYHEFGGPRDPHAIPQIARVTGYEQFTAQELEAFLRRHFEKVEIKPYEGSNLGLFWAEKNRGISNYSITTDVLETAPNALKTAPNAMAFGQNVPMFKAAPIPYVFSSCLCCAEHFRMPLYAHWCRAIGEIPRFHRKQWEFVYICQVLHEHKMFTNGKTAIGFGVGKEPLVSLFASCGVKVLATDLDVEETRAPGLVSTNQHSVGKTTLNDRGLCKPSDFEKLVSFRNIDMNKIPGDLERYDFCWSACQFEHLGSIRLGMDFVLNSCKLLKPGGMAVHTTEFNLTSNDVTIDNNKGFVIYRRRDIEMLERELASNGYRVETVDYYSGYDPLDKYVDMPPYITEPHLRLALGEYTATSIGLIIHNPRK